MSVSTRLSQTLGPRSLNLSFAFLILNQKSIIILSLLKKFTISFWYEQSFQKPFDTFIPFNNFSSHSNEIT